MSARQTHFFCFQSRSWKSAVSSKLLKLAGKETFNLTGFPLGLENLEKWEGIFQSGKSQGILNRLEKSGKSQGNITQNTGKLWEFEINII